jgi:acid phosphatase type 7
MTREISRREMLKEAAGGVTFLALYPVGRGLFAAAPTPDPLVLFTAAPYIQPGPSGGVLVEGGESVVIAWQTDDRDAEFDVSFGLTPVHYGRKAKVEVTRRTDSAKAEVGGRRNYAATLGGLRLGTTYHYRVRLGEHVIAEGYFTTRKARGKAVRFVAFGDNSYGEIGQRAVAYWAYRARPDFVMNTGDNVYEGGLDNEYQRYFFPIYNADAASPGVGAPLLRSVPFYTVMANHDVHGKGPDGHGPVADFDQSADALGYYTNLYLPLTGPAAPPQPTPIVGAAERLDEFRACAGERFPRMGNYSFDYGDAHFLCLDSNQYVDPSDPAWRAYVDQDLGSTDARWKFVVYHHPAFNVGLEHYTEQHMRVLSPAFEEHGVDFVLSGHEHTYQRTRPLRFQPAGPGKAAKRGSKDRLVPGVFTVDTKYDGKGIRVPDGVQYITTGAGGKSLYDADFTDNPEKWLRPEDGNVAYVARMVTDRHSFTTFEIDGETLVMTQTDQWGRQIDRLEVVKRVTASAGAPPRAVGRQ